MAPLTARFAGRRRLLLLAGAPVAAVVLALAGTLVLGGAEEDPYAGLSDAIAAGPEASGSGSGAKVQLGSVGTAPAGTPAGAAAAPVDDHEHVDDFDSGGLRDPFCPLIPSGPAGTPAVTCPEQAPAVAGQPMALLDVFAEGGHLHARVRVGPKAFTLHAEDAFDAYQVVSLSGTCGEFARGDVRRALCKGEEWDGKAAAPGA